MIRPLYILFEKVVFSLYCFSLNELMSRILIIIVTNIPYEFNNAPERKWVKFKHTEALIC